MALMSWLPVVVVPALFFIISERRRAMLLAMLPRFLRKRLSAKCWSKHMQRCPPETWGLAAAFCLVVFLRVCAPTVVPQWAQGSREGMQTFQDIEREWPMLKSADTLIAGQSFVRPLAIISALWRAGCSRRAGREAVVALPADSAVLLAAAMVARCVAFPLSGEDAYSLHGPAGGMMPIAFDVICLTLLFCLYISHTKPCRRMPLVAMLVLAVAVVSKNDLGLAYNKRRPGMSLLANKAFIMSCVLEVMSSVAHLLHAVLGPVTSGVGAVTTIQAVSQFFAAYYYIHVFPPGGEMSSVAKGFGTEIVTGGSLVQLGVSFLAIAVHVARSLDAVQDSTASSADRQRRKRTHRTLAESTPTPPSCEICFNGIKHQDDESSPRGSESSSSSGVKEAPQLLKLAPGVPQRCCAPKVCIAHECGSLFVGEEILEVRCSAGCVSAVHARCFRAASRTVRQCCALPGCEGRVARFGPISGLLESEDLSE